MNKSILVGVAILLLTISTLAGCILVPVDDGFHRGDSHEGGHGGHGGHRGGDHDRD